MRDETFASLKKALEDALAFERGERPDLNVTGIQAPQLSKADALKKQGNATPSETEVLDSVMQWKQKRRPALEAQTVASTIRNLGMLRWLDVKPDADLPVAEEDEMVEV